MLKNALLVTASIIAGAGGVQLLHAAAGTPVYAIAAIDVTNTEGYTKEFLPKTQPAIKEFWRRVSRRRDEQDHSVRWHEATEQSCHHQIPEHGRVE